MPEFLGTFRSVFPFAFSYGCYRLVDVDQKEMNSLLDEKCEQDPNLYTSLSSQLVHLYSCANLHKFIILAILAM